MRALCSRSRRLLWESCPVPWPASKGGWGGGGGGFLTLHLFCPCPSNSSSRSRAARFARAHGPLLSSSLPYFCPRVLSPPCLRRPSSRAACLMTCIKWTSASWTKCAPRLRSGECGVSMVHAQGGGCALRHARYQHISNGALAHAWKQEVAECTRANVAANVRSNQLPSRVPAMRQVRAAHIGC